MSKAAVFLDRDGVINENRADYVKSWDEVVFLPGVFDALAELAHSPLRVVIISNQSAVGRGLVTAQRVEAIHCKMVAEITRRAGCVDGIFYCPHTPEEGCSCRKPKPGLLLKAALLLDIALAQSYMIGDAASDMEAAYHAGCKPVLVLTGRGRDQLGRIEEPYRPVYIAEDLAQAVRWIAGCNVKISSI